MCLITQFAYSRGLFFNQYVYDSKYRIGTFIMEIVSAYSSMARLNSNENENMSVLLLQTYSCFLILFCDVMV